MQHDSDCIFCKIINGEIPSSKVYEDDDVLAFMDIGQVTEGHTLLIPKKHVEDVYALDEETASKIFRVVPRIASALRETFQCSGLNLVNNNGEKAEQSVFHYHLHFIPRYGNDHFRPNWVDNSEKYSTEDLQSFAQDVRSKLQLND